MNRKLKVMVEAITDVLDEFNVKGTIVRGKKHPHVEVVYQDERIRYTFAGTTGDGRAVLNMKSGLRRLLREVDKRKQAA